MKGFIIAMTVILGFFVVVVIILTGFVDIESPEMAKLVGVIVGYLTAMLNPVIMRYFNGGAETDKHDLM